METISAYIPLVTCIASLAFGAAVLDQFFARRKPYQLLWAVGLFMYAVSTFTEFWQGVSGINDTMFRLWYLIGAVYVAAYLGMGTLYLLMKRRHAHIIMVVLGVVSVYAAARIFTVDIGDVSRLTALSGRGVFPADVRLVLAMAFNTFGTLALVGGAVWSAWIFWRKRILPHRVTANILIAFGAMLPAAGGIHITVGGGINLFYLLELGGVIIMFLGFLRTKEVFGLYRFPLVHGFRRVGPEK